MMVEFMHASGLFECPVDMYVHMYLSSVPPPVGEVSVSEGEVPSVEVQAVEGEGGGGGGGGGEGGEGGGGGDVNYKRKMEDEGSEEERSAKNPRSASPDFTSLKVGIYTFTQSCVYLCTLHVHKYDMYDYIIMIRIISVDNLVCMGRHVYRKPKTTKVCVHVGCFYCTTAYMHHVCDGKEV